MSSEVPAATPGDGGRDSNPGTPALCARCGAPIMATRRLGVDVGATLLMVTVTLALAAGYGQRAVLTQLAALLLCQLLLLHLGLRRRRRDRLRCAACGFQARGGDRRRRAEGETAG